MGATPTNGANRLLQKFGLVPKMPRAFGERHHYYKPEKTYKMMHYTGLGKNFTREQPNRVALMYKQKLQEQMNIVERKRRLQREAIENAGEGKYATQVEADLDGQDTDGMESEEADIFERKRKFEKVLAKM